MKLQEFKDMTAEELERKIKELKENLFKLKVKLNTKQLEKTAQVKTARKEIARALTILKQKKSS